MASKLRVRMAAMFGAVVRGSGSSTVLTRT